MFASQYVWKVCVDRMPFELSTGKLFEKKEKKVYIFKQVGGST